MNLPTMDSLMAELLAALVEARPFVAFAFDSGLLGAEEAGLMLDAAIAKATGANQLLTTG